MKAVRRVVLGFVSFIAASVAAALVLRRFVPESGDESDRDVVLVAAMEGREFANTSDEFRSARMFFYMAGGQIDLSGAEIDGVATLTIRSVMGGVDVIVPHHWRVEAQSVSVLGGFQNDTTPDDVDDAAPTLVVDAVLVMAGAVIRTQGAEDGS